MAYGARPDERRVGAAVSRAGLAIAKLAVVATLALGACTSAPSPTPSPPRPPRPTTRPAPLSPPSARRPPAPPTAQRVVDLAKAHLEAPYRYAGKDPRGFDCSGLVLYVFAKVGIALPRTAELQAKRGSWVAPDELGPGDLVFFGDTRAKPFHVGLVVSETGSPLTMIHASSSRGVVETEITSSSYWLPRLRFGRRVLPR